MSSSKKIVNKLKTYSNQAGHFIIIDVGHPMTDQTKKKIISSLKRVILLTGHLNGKSKIPAFGIAALDSSYTMLHSISTIKGSLNEIMDCFDKLYEKDINGTKITLDDYSLQLFNGVLDIMKDFSIKSENVKSGNKIWLTWPSQMQITLVTAKKASPIVEIFADIVDSNKNLPSKLKQIDVLEIHQEDELKLSNGIHKHGFISSISSSDCSVNLDCLFKKWLLETNAYKEHVRIIVNQDLVLKCDINDGIIDPDTLPFGHRFRLRTWHWFPATTGIEGLNDAQIYELKIIKRVNESCFNMSYTFGYPRRLVPTQCWKLSLDEISSNNEWFTSLLQELKESEVGLLAEWNHEENTLNAMSTYFLITTDGESLLLKSIAGMELILPRSSQLPNNVSDETKIFVRKSLEKLPIIENYSPRDFQTNLYSCLENGFKKAMPPKLSNPLKHKSLSQLQSPDRSKKKCEEKKIDQMDASLDSPEPGEYVPDFVSKKQRNKIKKSPIKRSARKKILNECLHPAFLPAEIKEALRNKKCNQESRELELLLAETEFSK